MDAKPVYLGRPWLKAYLAGVPADVEIAAKSVNEAFDEAAEKWKDHTAVTFYGRRISYGELKEKVDRFATALHDLGVRKGDRVAMLMLNSPEYMISYYGVVKAGGVVSPISPVYVSPEIRHQLQDSGAERIICQDILYDAVARTGLKLKQVILANIADSLPPLKRFMGKSVLKGVYQKMAAPSPEIQKQEWVYPFRELIRKYPPSPPRLRIDPEEDLVSLPYTGGTTGKPKGVMITHRNVIAEALIFQRFYPFIEEGNTIWIGYMPFYHAAGQARAVQNGILYGYNVVTIVNPDPDVVLSAVARYKPTTFLGAPTMYEILKDYKKTDRVQWKNLKIVLSGADALHEFTAKDWRTRTGVDLHDVYGMTELTGFSHGCPAGKPRVGSIGVPAVNTLAAILDPDRDEYLPVGEMGEMVVAGPQVTKGYWKNPEATRECEAIIDGIRWWRTGDLGRMDEEGFFYLYDRKRDLIKYKGLRVYAREVEEVLKTHPQIKEAGVIGVPEPKVGENVKAFVVLETDARGKLSEEDITKFCSDKLAHYKIPRVIDFVGEIPKTDVGKVSRRELREEEG